MVSFFDNPNEYPEHVCLNDFEANSIPFRINYYKNSKIGFLLKKLQSFDLVLIIALIFIFIVSIVNTIRLLVKLVKNKAVIKLRLKFISFLILVLLIGFVYVTMKTATTDSLLILFGLIKEANYIFYIIILISVLIVLEFIQWLRTNSKSKWELMTFTSFLFFIIIVLNYRLIPNF